MGNWLCSAFPFSVRQLGTPTAPRGCNFSFYNNERMQLWFLVVLVCCLGGEPAAYVVALGVTCDARYLRILWELSFTLISDSPWVTDILDLELMQTYFRPDSISGLRGQLRNRDSTFFSGDRFGVEGDYGNLLASSSFIKWQSSTIFYICQLLCWKHLQDQLLLTEGSPQGLEPLLSLSIQTEFQILRFQELSLLIF